MKPARLHVLLHFGGWGMAYLNKSISSDLVALGKSSYKAARPWIRLGDDTYPQDFFTIVARTKGLNYQLKNPFAIRGYQHDNPFCKVVTQYPTPGDWLLCRSSRMPISVSEWNQNSEPRSRQNSICNCEPIITVTKLKTEAMAEISLAEGHQDVGKIGRLKNASETLVQVMIIESWNNLETNFLTVVLLGESGFSRVDSIKIGNYTVYPNIQATIFSKDFVQIDQQKVPVSGLLAWPFLTSKEKAALRNLVGSSSVATTANQQETSWLSEQVRILRQVASYAVKSDSTDIRVKPNSALQGDVSRGAAKFGQNLYQQISGTAESDWSSIKASPDLVSAMIRGAKPRVQSLAGSALKMQRTIDTEEIIFESSNPRLRDSEQFELKRAIAAALELNLRTCFLEVVLTKPTDSPFSKWSYKGRSIEVLHRVEVGIEK